MKELLHKELELKQGFQANTNKSRFCREWQKNFNSFSMQQMIDSHGKFLYICIDLENEHIREYIQFSKSVCSFFTCSYIT